MTKYPWYTTVLHSLFTEYFSYSPISQQINSLLSCINLGPLWQWFFNGYCLCDIVGDTINKICTGNNFQRSSLLNKLFTSLSPVLSCCWRLCWTTGRPFSFSIHTLHGATASAGWSIVSTTVAITRYCIAMMRSVVDSASFEKLDSTHFEASTYPPLPGWVTHRHLTVFRGRREILNPSWVEWGT